MPNSKYPSLTGAAMFELWVVTEGNGEGEILLTDAGDKADLPPQLRRRVRKVGPGAFSTKAEANHFRRKCEALRDFRADSKCGQSTASVAFCGDETMAGEHEAAGAKIADRGVTTPRGDRSNFGHVASIWTDAASE